MPKNVEMNGKFAKEPDNLYEYIEGLYKGSKLNKADRNHFASLKQCNLKIEEKQCLFIKVNTY